MALDTKAHRLFSGCRSGVLAVSDYVSGKVVATAPIGMGVDGTAFDASSGDIFAAGADGTLTVIHQDSPDQYHVVETVKTPEASRNLGLDPTSHRLYLPAAEFAPAAGNARPSPAAGTFRILVIERSSGK
jgi:hypothetical protein